MPKKNEDPKGELPPIWTDTQDDKDTDTEQKPETD